MNIITRMSKDIYQILKSTSETVKAYSKDGDDVADPTEDGRRFVTDDKLQVTVGVVDEKLFIRVYVPGDEDETHFDEFSYVIEHLRNVATKYGATFSLKEYFNENLSESNMVGSSKSSYQKLGKSTRLIVRHDKSIDPEKRGARSRNIKSMFIEDNCGQRLMFPVPYLQGARAMTRHIANDGTMDDEVGSDIVNLSNCHCALRRSLKHLRGIDDSFADFVRGKIREIGSSLKSAQTPRGYGKFRDDRPVIIISEESTEDLQQKYGVEVSDAGYLASLRKEYEEKMKKDDDTEDAGADNVGKQDLTSDQLTESVLSSLSSEDVHYLTRKSIFESLCDDHH